MTITTKLKHLEKQLNRLGKSMHIVESTMGHVHSILVELSTRLSNLEAKELKSVENAGSNIPFNPFTDPTNAPLTNNPLSPKPQGSAVFPKGTKMIPVKNPNFPKIAVSTVHSLSDNAGRGTVGAAIVATNRDNWKEEMTAGVNQNAANMVAERMDELTEGSFTPANTSEMVTLMRSKVLIVIHSNSTTSYFKRIKGRHCGSLLSQDHKTGVITDHRYYATTPFSKQLCLVSKDQDGIDYINRVVRPSLTERNPYGYGCPKLVRYYRPGNRIVDGGRKHLYPTKTFCAVYIKDAEQYR